MKNTTQNGFSLIEMLLAAALFSVLIGAAIMYSNMSMQDANRDKLIKEQAREMAHVAKGLEQYMVANSKNWTLDSLQTVSIDTLITATFLPPSFARRPDMSGTTYNGVSPFGSRYNMSAIAALKDGKRVHRGVVWETGTPIAWARYAKIGIAQGSEPVNSSGANSKLNAVKMEIARALNSQQQHPAPGIANVGAATARGAMGSWVQDVAAFLGTGGTFAVPSVVILAGWPEYGSVLPPTTQANNFGTCTVQAAHCGTGGDLCLYPSSVPTNGVCPAGQIEVKRFPHCGSVGTIVSVPEVGSSLSYGQEGHVLSDDPVTEPDQAQCIYERPGNPSWQDYCIGLRDEINGGEATDYASYGTVRVNDTQMAFYQCSATTYQYTTGITRPSVYGPVIKEGPFGRTDVLCCLPGN